MSKFNQYTNQTGWSDVDHQQWFYDGLNNKIKDTLSYMDLPTTTLTKLCEAMSKLDRHIQQHEAKKCGYNTSIMAPQGTQNKDPDAMQVDATQQGGMKKTCTEYIKFMN